MNCTCGIYLMPTDHQRLNDNYCIRYCPMHEAAPAMYKAIKFSPFGPELLLIAAGALERIGDSGQIAVIEQLRKKAEMEKEALALATGDWGERSA